MAALTYFSVVADFLAVVGDQVGDVDFNPDTIPITGTVSFTPVLNPGDMLLARTLSPRPASVLPAKITATIDTDGQLKYGGQVGVRLVSNTDVLELTGDLVYKVEFNNITVASTVVPIKSFNFTAPDDDETINLVDIARIPGSTSAAGIARGPQGYGFNGFTIVSAGPPTVVQAVDSHGDNVGSPITISVTGTPTTIDNITDATTVGKASVRAASQAAGRTAIGAGTASTKADVGLGSADNTADSAKPVSTAQAAADAAVLSAAESYADARFKPIESGTFPWPAGLVALWDFQQDTAGGATVTSRVGSQVTTLTALASKTVVKDAADPGPFGPSLVLDGATAFVLAGNLGALDATLGDEITVAVLVKDTANNHDDGGGNGLAFRAGSHNDGSTPSRQYGSYFDADSPSQSKGKYTPHISSQDGVAAGYVFSADNAATARKMFTGTGQGQWHLETFTFNGAELAAYIDGILDSNPSVPEPAISGQTAPERIVDRNPYPCRKGINRSQTTKRFSIGASSHWNGTTDVGFSFTTGKLGFVAVFNRALSSAEIMKLRLATLLSGDPITMYGFEVTGTGAQNLRHIGWSARAGAANGDVSGMNANGPEYAVTRPVSGSKAFLQKTSTGIGACLGPVSGLNSSQLARVRFLLMSAGTGSAAQRLLVKVGSKWWASNTTYAATSTHGGDTDWTGAETKTHTIDWNAGNWREVTMTDTGGTQTFQNLVKNPNPTTVGTDWFKSSGAAHATATGRVSDGAGGFVYRITWTGTDNGSVNIGGKSQSGIGTLTAGTVYSASMVVKPSKVQQLRLQIIWYDAGNAQISTSDGQVVNVGNASTTLVASGTAPAGAVAGALMVQSVFPPAISWLSGDTIDLSNAIMVAGSVLPAYFDGATSGAGWDGSAWGSSSTYTNMPTGVLSLAGSTNTAYIDNALLTAIGFLSSGGDGSVVRVTDLELLPN